MRQAQKELENELTWSHSRMRMFDECLREYYYHYYLKWNGWKPDAPPNRKTAYRLSKMTSFDLETGNVVHESIAQMLKRLRETGKVVTEQEAIRDATMMWDRARRESLSGNWRQDPGKVKCFLEDYYGYPEIEEKSALKRDAIVGCIQGFYASKTWEQIQKLKTSKWLAMDTDPFAAETVYGIPMHGRPDLALSSVLGDKSVFRLFDWKTGRQRPSDANQLGFYALYAAKVWECPPHEIVARLVYLQTPPRQVDLPVSEALINDSFETMTESFDRMKAVLKDVERNIPLPIERFPQSVSNRTCPRCNFQELCFGGAWKGTPGAVDDDGEVVWGEVEESAEFD